MYACECNVGQTTRVIRFNPGFSVPENKIEKLKTTYYSTAQFIVPVLRSDNVNPDTSSSGIYAWYCRRFGRYHTNNTPH